MSYINITQKMEEDMQKKYIWTAITLSACITMVHVMPVLAGKIIGHASASTNANYNNTVQTVSTNFDFLASGMYTYQKMESDIELLKQRYEGVTSDSIGTTTDGRNLYRIVIGSRDAKKKILVVGAIHAREYITAPLVMRQIKEMLDKREDGDKSLDEICIEYVPMVNPDGVTNRADSRKRPCNEFYKGASAGSESETQYLITLVNNENFDAVLNYHTQGQIIYWSNQHAAADVLAKDRAMADIVAAYTGYKLVAPEADGSKYGTGFKDWLDWEKGIPNVTVEVGIGTSPVPEAQIESIWQQNTGVLPDIVKYILGK